MSLPYLGIRLSLAASTLLVSATLSLAGGLRVVHVAPCFNVPFGVGCGRAYSCCPVPCGGLVYYPSPTTGYYPTYLNVYYGASSFYYGHGLTSGSNYAGSLTGYALLGSTTAPPDQANVPARPEPSTSSRPDVAEVDLTVPTDTELWMQGVKMNQTGAVRRFVSPSLQPGLVYDYEVRATYLEGNRPVTTVRTLRVQAGERRQINLMSLPVAAVNLTATAAQR